MKFGFESHRKGALLLRMFKDALGEEVFLNGVKLYLNEMLFKSASPEDLYRGLQKAYDEAYPGNDLSIEKLMDTWTNSRGFPIVTVSRSENGLLLTQDGLGSNEIFGIPINYATRSKQNFDNVTAELWMTTKTFEITRENSRKTWTDEDWVIFNLRDTGYYLTNYDDTLWALITDSLSNDHEAIHFLNRGTLFADIDRFIEHAVYFRASIFLEMEDSMKLEHHPHVWRRANRGLRRFETRLRGTVIHTMHLNFLNSVMSKIYGREFENGQEATEVVNLYSCLSGVQACVNDAMGALIEVMESGLTSFPFNYRCNAFRVANETVWMHFVNDAMIQNSTNRDRTLAFRDLACTQNPNLIKHLIGIVMNTNNDMLISERSELLRSIASEHHEGYNAVVELIEEQHEAVIAM